MTAYEFDGEKYRAAAKPQREWGGRLLAGLELSGGESILDLGCGDGSLTAGLAELVPAGRVLGIDASAGMIAAAKKLEGGNLAFAQLDIGDLSFSEGFDVVFSNAALHWVKDHPALLANSLRALKTGGRVAWSFAGSGNCAAFYGTVRRLIAADGYAAYFRNFTWPWYMPSEEEYRRLAERSGFREISVTTRNADRRFSRRDLIAWLDQPCLVPFLSFLKGEARQAFREEVIREMLAETRTPDGDFFETFRRLEVRAVK